MIPKKICIITGSRAEFGLLRFIIEGVQKSSFLELQLIVTGMHLSSEFGLTYKALKIHNPWLLENHLNNKSRKVYTISIPSE